MSFAPEPNTTELPPGLTVERATADDADTFLGIHEEAARWLWERGIRQWRPGAFQREWLDEPIARGELYIARLRGEPVGTLLIQWSDEYTWGKRPDDSGYIHGLRVRRSASGRELGQALLRWAEGEIARAGRTYARLDCIANNPALCAYYERAGYTRVDDLAVVGEEKVHLARFEKRVDQARGDGA